MNSAGGPMKGGGAHYGQAMVDQRPVFDNQVRKRKKKKKKHGDSARKY